MRSYEAIGVIAPAAVDADRSFRSWTPTLSVSIAATAVALAFAWYQSPDWHTFWTDQGGYRRLGEVLATTGRFTRYPEARTYVPEVLRTPGYPAFVAVMYRLFGTSQLAVVIPQAVVCGLLSLVVYRIAAYVTSPHAATWCALAVALYPPVPYFAALVMTEVWTTFVVTTAMWLTLRAVMRESRGGYALAGAVCGAAALCRPVFVLLPVAIAGAGALLAAVQRRRLAGWALFLVAAAAVLSPWFAYNYHHFHRLTISPAGGVGRATWEGSWQGTWPGRVQATLTDIADHQPERAALDREVATFAATTGRPEDPMLRYVHQWQDIRRIWTEPTESDARARARVAADAEYWRVGLENIRAQPLAWAARRATTGLFVLWAGDLPIRYSDINRTPGAVIHAIWTADAALALLAVLGILALVGTGRLEPTVLLGTLIVYVTAVHLPLLTEARQSLPAKPVMIALAVAGVATWWTRRRATRG
jgi:4-amino-4-deoxy-L-arabinose transferase-like glycosyltransferase